MDDPIRETGLHLAELLDLEGEGPLYRRISDALRRAVDRGEIALGTILPPERTLASALSVSRATVVAAYERLKADGWLESLGMYQRLVRDTATAPTGNPPQV